MDIGLDPRDTLLLVVDIQEKLVPAMPADQAAAVVRNTVNLMHAAAAVGVPVVLTEQYPKGLGPTVAPIKEALALHPKARVVEKDCFSCVKHPDVLPLLNGLGKRRVLVVGMEAHVCVALTARDLIGEGFITQVAHDACSSRRPADHAVALDLMRSGGVAITTTETVILDWLGGATHPAFKELSRRIK